MKSKCEWFAEEELTMDSILKLENVSFGYTQNLVLNNINLSIEKGEFVGLVGVNGSGKSTLLKVILGVLKPTSGNVLKDKNTKIGYVNQTTSVEEGSFPATVYEVVSLGLKKKPFHFINKKDKNAVDKVLELFSLSQLKNRSIESLSGGQAQKVKIAKVLLANPDIIVFDEPTTGIDAGSEEVLLEMINHLHAMKKTIILVSHNPSNLATCDKIYQIVDQTLEEANV